MLKSNKKTFFIFFIFLLSLAVSVFFGIQEAMAANQVNVTAYVVDKNGQTLPDGEYNIRFAIYLRSREEMDPYPSNTDAGSRIWQENQKITIFGGVLSVYLGAINPLPNNIDFNQNDYYLGVQIGTDSEMAPRKKLGAAFSSINSSFLQGRTIGNDAENIPVLGSNGGLDPVILDKITRVGTISQGTWEGDVIADDFIAQDLTGKTYNGLNIKTSGGNRTLTVSSNVTLNQNLSTSSTPTFAAINLTDGLPIASGGTNATSIGEAGGVAYSDGTSYAFTSAGTAGQYLVSNGSGAPTWQAIAGGGVGGLGLAGHMAYWSDANNLTYDTNGNFYWDATNNRLGIGTLAPAQALDIAGSIRSTGQFISTVASGTAPMQVSSNTLVANLNADYLDGQHASAFLTGNQTITLSGDVTGSGTTSIATTIANNSVDGTDIALGSDAQGDIMYYNGTDWARLAAGVGGQFLATNGAGANPSWGVPSGAGDITAIGNVVSGEAFTGTQGTELYFNDSDGDGLLTIDNLSTARIYTLPNASGTVITSGNLTDITATGIIASGTWNGGVIDEAYGGTGMAAYAEGDMLYYDGGTLTRLAAGTNGQILGAVGGAGNVNPTWMDAPFVGSHNLLSLSHPDTTAASPLAGDLITGIDTGGGTIRWQRYAIGAANDILMTNGTGNGVDWNPQTSITQLGTITAGTWNGTDIDVTHGGTGLGTINQGGILYADANDSLAALEGAVGDDTEYLRFHWNGGAPYVAWETASGSFTSFTLSGDSGANQTISDANTLEIAGGTNINSVASATDTITLNLDSTLTGTTWNGNTIGVGYGGTGITGTPTNGQLLIGNGTNYTLAILTDGAGINITEGSGTITIASTLGASVDLTSEVTGILPIANGGTNTNATPTAGAISYGTGSAYAFNSAGTAGQVLLSGGAGAPTWTTGTLTLAGNFITSGANSLTLTTTGITNVTLPTGGTLATLAGSETLTNKTIGSGSTWNGNTIGTTYITNDSLLEIDFDVTNEPVNDYILSYDETSGGFTWIENTGGSGESKWSDGGAFTYLTQTGDDLVLGSDGTTNAPFWFDVSDSSITFEGATANDYETKFVITDPTADRTITFPDGSGTVVFSGGSGSSLWTNDGSITYLTETGDDMVVGGSDLSSPLSVDVSANTVRIGDGTAAGSAILNMYASDGDTGSITYNTNDAWAFEGGNVGIGDTSPLSLFTVGSGDLFQINSSGQIAAAAGVTSSGTITFSGLTTDGVVTASGGVLGSEAQLAITRGGTNTNATPTAGAISYGTGSAYAFNTAGTAGQVLLSGGAGAPTWTTGTLTLAGNFITSGANSLTLTTTGETNVTLPVGGTLATLAGSESFTNKTIGSGSTWNGNTIGVGYGGTGITGTPTNGQLLIGNGTNYTLANLASSSASIAITNTAGGINLESSLGTSVSLTSEVTGTLPVGYGGTGITTAGLTGVPVISSGTWSVDTNALAVAHGGTGEVSEANLEDKIEGYVFDEDAETISGAWTVSDNVALRFGTNNDLQIAYDETTDDRMEITDGSNLLGAFSDAGTVGNLYLTGGISTFDNTVTAGYGEFTGLCLGNGTSCITEWSSVSGVTGSGSAGNAVYWSSANELGSEPQLATSRGGTGMDTATAEGVPIITAGTWSVSSILGAALGGTGIDGSSAGNGTLLIGNGSGYSLTTLTDGTGITITEASGSITIDSTLGTSVDGTEIAIASQAQGDVLYYNGTAWTRLAAGSAGQYLQGGTAPSWDTPTGAGDVTNVGDCAGGACFDGTDDGGTYLSFYDPQGTGQLITGNLTQARVWTLPDATGTVALTSDLHTASTVTDTTSIDMSITGQQISGVVLPAGVDHNSLANLTTGDYHTQYALLTGRSGGQTLIGGTASGDDLTLQTTSDVTKGSYILSDLASGLVLSTSGTLSVITNNSTNWDAGYTNRLTGVTDNVTGLDFSLGSNNVTLALTSGYVIPTTTQETNWGSAYSHSTATTNVHGLTFTAEGSGGGLDADTLDGHDTAYFQVAGSYQPLHANLTSLSALSYSANSFVKMTAAGTFALDTNTYLTSYTETDPRLPAVGTSGNLLQSDGSAWTSWTPNYLTSYTETDPIWTAAAGNYFNLSENETVTGIPAFNGGTTGASAPFTVDSTYLVTNLNADLLDGQTGSYYQTAYTNLTSIGSLANSAGWLYNNGSGTFSYSTPTGLISGLTANYIPYATSATALGNSGMYWDSGNSRLGIGTTTPSSKLDIYGTSNSLRLSYDASNYGLLSTASNGDLTITSSNMTETAIVIGNNAALDASIQFDENTQDYYFGVDNTDHFLKMGLGTAVGITPYFAMDTSGNVGIGTVTPSQALELGASKWLAFEGATDNTYETTIQVTDPTADNVITFPDVTGTVWTSGNDGSGSTLDADTLDGHDTSYFQAANTNLTSIGSLANATGWLYNNGSGTFSYSTPTGLLSGLTANYIPYATSATALGDSGMYWDSGNSRLGIGTITPGAALQIGTLTPANITTPANSLMVSGDLEVGGSIFMGPMSFPADSGAISWIDMPVSTSVAADTVESYTASLGGTSILTIYGEALGAAGGVDATRVGIGTTTPGNLLSIQQAGTATNNTNIFSLTNSGNGASMTNTRTSILFNQYYYDAATPALVDSGNISVGTEGNWTSTTSTQDAYMAFSTVLNGTMGEKMRISSAGYLGIGIIAPTALLHLNGAAGTVGFELNSNETTNASDVLMIRSDVAGADDAIFRITAAGNVYADGTFTPSGADYAEYFKTKDTDLQPGEAVCIDSQNENAVVRCGRTGDSNIMGIVSSTPSVIGNARDGRENDPNYKVIGMIGQIIGNVSTTENGEITVGDNLTAASTAGYMRKANAGESTVGIAMENFDGTKGQIHILISRRNQSLTVEKVEEAVEKNIAAMELQDQVDNLVSQASSNLNAQIENLSTTFSPAQKNIITAGITAATDPIIAMQNKLQSQMDLIQEQNDVIAGFIANMDVASMLYDESLNLGSGLLEADGIVAGALTVKIEDEKNKTIGSNYIEPKDEDNDGKSYIIKTKAVTETATIFTSFQANPNAYSWVEKVKDPETDEYIGFKINLNSEVSSRVYFDWWIVEKDDRTEEPKIEDSIEASTEASIEASTETVPAQTTKTETGPNVIEN